MTDVGGHSMKDLRAISNSCIVTDKGFVSKIGKAKKQEQTQLTETDYTLSGRSLTNNILPKQFVCLNVTQDFDFSESIILKVQYNVE